MFKKWHLIILAIIVVSFIFLKLYDWLYWPHSEIVINERKLTVLVADTPTHWAKGWSGKNDMGNYQGMLFKFADKRQHVMVMRDMEFPLDIVWLDGNVVIDMAPGLAPEKGKQDGDLTRYGARLPSTAVLELPAGFLEANGLKIGDNVGGL